MFVPCAVRHRKFRIVTRLGLWVPRSVGVALELEAPLGVGGTKPRPRRDSRNSDPRPAHCPTRKRVKSHDRPQVASTVDPWVPGTTLASESRCCDLPCVAEPPHSSRCLGAKPAYPECCQRVLRRLYGVAITEVFSCGLGGVARPAAGRVALPCSGAPCADGRASVRRRPLPRACAVGPCA